MAQFYASIQGNRSERTCMGTKNSGISGHIRGWNIGAHVDVNYNKDIDDDIVTVTITRGSSGAGLSKSLGSFYLNKKNLITKMR